MDVRPADILVMKKPHPCGSQTMYVIRAGMDFKLRCTCLLYTSPSPRDCS